VASRAYLRRTLYIVPLFWMIQPCRRCPGYHHQRADAAGWHRHASLGRTDYRVSADAEQQPSTPSDWC